MIANLINTQIFHKLKDDFKGHEKSHKTFLAHKFF